MVQRSREKEQKQQRFNWAEKNLLKECETEGISSYAQNSSGRLDSYTERNSFISEIFRNCSFLEDMRHTRNLAKRKQIHTALLSQHLQNNF